MKIMIHTLWKWISLMLWYRIGKKKIWMQPFTFASLVKIPVTGTALSPLVNTLLLIASTVIGLQPLIQERR